MEAPETNRIAFTVQYDGSHFFGWQLQRELRTVQGELEAVLSRLFDSPARVVGSGRTDRGVHALGQVAAVHAPVGWTAAELLRSMNALLPETVRVSAAAIVEERFHPRFDALERSYIYRLGYAPDSFSPFHSRWCWPLEKAPDPDLMEAATAAITGDRSFLAFAKAGQEHRGDRCIVSSASWCSWDQIGVEFHISANRFLHHMVRYLVGTLVEIGLGRRPGQDMAALLAGDSGLKTSPPAPASGLFLSAVRYADGAYPPAGLSAPGTAHPELTQ